MSENKALADFTAQSKMIREQLQKRVGRPTRKFISLKDKMFKMPNGGTAKEINVVVVDFAAKNEFYEGAYDPQAPKGPSCVAVGMDKHANLIPAKTVTDPEFDNCAGCPNNQFGSKGKGKACKNGYILAVFPADGYTESTEFSFINVSPTGITPFDKFVTAVGDTLELPPVGAIVTLSFEDVHYAKLKYTNVQPNPKAAEMFARMDEAKKLLLVEPEAKSGD